MNKGFLTLAELGVYILLIIQCLLKPVFYIFKKSPIISSFLVVFLMGIVFKLTNIDAAIYKFIVNVIVNNEQVITKINSDNTLSQYKELEDTIYNSLSSVEKDFNIEILKLYYIPNGFKQDSITVASDINQDRIRITILYTNLDNNNNIIYNIYVNKSISTNSKLIQEKVNADVEEYKFNDLTFLVFKNNNWYSSKWTLNNINYEIQGIRSKQEILNIIEKIKY